MRNAALLSPGRSAALCSLLILVLALPPTIFAGQARSVILVIPDGMSMAALAVARAAIGGPPRHTNFDRLPQFAHGTTYSSDSYITDSAAGATAMATGHKTKNGVLGEDSTAVPGIRHGKRLTTILEMARSSGRSTGLVTTTHITHATPAGFYAHWYDRDQETVIAEALINANVSVLMGGGRAFFLPQTARDPEDGLPGERKDGANLIDSLVAQGYRYAWNKSGFDSIDARRTKRLLGLFEFAHMEFEADRPQDVAGEPSLSEMTGKTLEILSRNPKGFFLMVEAGRIDHAAHALDADRWVSDILACDQAIGVALDFARKDGKTLLVVAPDHGTGGPAYIGQRGHDPEGPVETTGFPDYVDSNGDGFPDNVPRRPMAIGWASSPTFTKDTTYVGDHVADDVPIFAYGPGSERVHGALDNTDVFRIMAAAIGVK